MDSLLIEATEDSPSINFDTHTNHFVITGESRPENAGKFYTPIIDWLLGFEKVLDKRKQNNVVYSDKIVFVFQLDYFNSTSAKFLMDLILTLKGLIDKGHSITIEWKYDKRDDDMLEVGKEFSEMSDLKFNFVEM